MYEGYERVCFYLPCTRTIFSSDIRHIDFQLEAKVRFLATFLRYAKFRIRRGMIYL
jgi:hypothetical protein